MGKIIQFASAMMVFVLMSGCASNIGLIKYKGVSANIASTEQVSIIVKPYSPYISSKKGYIESKLAFEQSMRDKLIANDRFENVRVVNSDVDARSGFLLDVTFRDFEYLSGAASFFGGVFTGNAVLNVRVKLVDIKNQKLLGDYFAKSGTGYGGGIFRGSTSSLIDAITDELAREIILTSNS